MTPPELEKELVLIVPFWACLICVLAGLLFLVTGHYIQTVLMIGLMSLVIYLRTKQG